MVSIADLFNPAPAQPATSTPVQPQDTNVQQQQPDPAASPQTAPNGTVPNGDTINNQQDNSPLASFKDLWETKPNESDKSKPSESSLDLSPEKIAQAVAKTDLTKAITPEILSAISEGGEAAQTAFASALDAVSKQTLTQATLVSSELAKRLVAEAIQQQSASLPDLLRDQSVKSHMHDADPVFSNPAIQPVVEATRSQLQAKFPQATPTEITNMTKDYILAMGAAFAPQQTSESQGGVDWDKYLTS